MWSPLATLVYKRTWDGEEEGGSFLILCVISKMYAPKIAHLLTLELARVKEEEVKTCEMTA